MWFNGPDEEVQRTGHADVFEDGQGRWWAVFLGVRPVKVDGEYLEPQLGPSAPGVFMIEFGSMEEGLLTRMNE